MGAKCPLTSIGFRTLLVIALLALGLGTPPIARATTITVTNTGDSGSGSLRQAIADAAPNDTITFAVTGTISLTSGELVVGKTLNISGPGADQLAVSGNLTSRVFNNSGRLTLSGVTIMNGNVTVANDVGGGLYNTGAITLTTLVITNSKGLQGGGLYSASGAVKIINSTIDNNRADIGDGGGLFNDGTSVLTVIGTTLSGNFAEQNAGGILAGNSATIVNSTLSGNTAKGGGGGLGGFGTVTLNNVTLTGNGALKLGGGLRQIAGATTIKNSIVAGNLGPSGSPDCVGTITSGGHNLIGQNTGCSFSASTGDQVGTSASPINPQLGPLANNGGATLTHALLGGSPAIDAGNPATPGSGGTSCEATDQRALARPIDGDLNGSALCDSGAFEFLPGNVVLASNSSPTTLGHATFLTATAAGSNVTYQWNFGDGAIGIANPISHTYTAAGFYTAIVTATNGANSVTATTHVTVTNLAPIADAGPNQSASLNALVTLNGSASNDPDGHTPLSYGWQQSGGLNVVLSSPTISMPTFTAPATSGILTFTLTVTDARGLAGAPAQTLVFAGDVPISNLIAANSSPTTLGQATTFTATALGSQIGYQWDFGDGATSNTNPISHTYSTAGFYTAIVTASNSVNTLTATTVVTVLAPHRIYLPLILGGA